jgi:hypothetical protein
MLLTGGKNYFGWIYSYLEKVPLLSERYNLTNFQSI